MPSRLSPATWFALVMLLAALMLSFGIVTAMRQPALGLTLGWDGTAQAPGFWPAMARRPPFPKARCCAGLPTVPMLSFPG